MPSRKIFEKLLKIAKGAGDIIYGSQEIWSKRNKTRYSKIASIFKFIYMYATKTFKDCYRVVSF